MKVSPPIILNIALILFLISCSLYDNNDIKNFYEYEFNVKVFNDFYDFQVYDADISYTNDKITLVGYFISDDGEFTLYNLIEISNDSIVSIKNQPILINNIDTLHSARIRYVEDNENINVIGTVGSFIIENKQNKSTTYYSTGRNIDSSESYHYIKFFENSNDFMLYGWAGSLAMIRNAKINRYHFPKNPNFESVAIKDDSLLLFSRNLQSNIEPYNNSLYSLDLSTGNIKEEFNWDETYQPEVWFVRDMVNTNNEWLIFGALNITEFKNDSIFYVDQIYTNYVCKAQSSNDVIGFNVVNFNLFHWNGDSTTYITDINMREHVRDIFKIDYENNSILIVGINNQNNLVVIRGVRNR